MPLAKLRIKPGVSVEFTPTLNSTSFSASQLMRFFAGLAQKIGGWQAYTTQPLIGTCLGMLGWADQLGNPFVACGTEQRLQVVSGGAISDITPIAATTNPAPAFTTAVNSSIVTITDGARSPAVGDFINIIVPVSVGGLLLTGFYRVVEAVDGTHYQVDAGTPAPAGISDGGAVPLYSTQAGSPVITVTLANHGLGVSDIFNAQVPTTVGGQVISGLFNAATVSDSGHFTIIAPGNANATISGSENAGNVRIQYLIPTGFATDTSLTGWGIGDFGLGDWGQGTATQSTIAPARVWSLDHFGQALIASPRNGAIYQWTPPTIQPATLVSANAPLFNNAVFVVSTIEVVVALGAESGGTQFPTLIRWCDVADFTDWTPAVSNQAGSFQLSSGSTCIGGLAIGLSSLIWTDVDLWSMSYIGFPLVFSFNRMASGCGAIAARAQAVVGNTVIWPTKEAFYTYSSGGEATPIECPVWDFFFNNIDHTQPDLLFAARNSLFTEIAWHFPFTGGGFAYVKLNVLENLWDFGPLNTLPRSAWIDQSPAGNPIGVDTSGILQQHETGFDANGQPIISFVQTGFFDVHDGDDYVRVDLIIPDFISNPGGASLQITLLTQEYPNGPVTTWPTYTVTPGTTFVSCNVRGRQIAIRVGSSDLGSFWRFGAVRYRFAPDGKR